MSLSEHHATAVCEMRVHDRGIGDDSVNAQTASACKA